MPDSTEPVIAWRVWRVRRGRLVSLYKPIVWTPKTALRDALGMGIYALKSPKFDGGLPSTFSLVYGRVALWGRIHEFTEGYTAEVAYPVSLARLRGLVRVKQLCKTYGIAEEVAPRRASVSIMAWVLWSLATLGTASLAITFGLLFYELIKRIFP